MPEGLAAGVVVRRAAERFETVADGLRTLHSFSYGAHYDPENVAFGPLVALNEEHVAPGAGYDAHRHADVEIVTWVLSGELAHEDTSAQGVSGVVRPGSVQRLSAGEGVEHTERNASGDEPLVFVQMMLRARFDPDAPTADGGASEHAEVVVPEGAGVHATVAVDADAELLVVRPSDTVVEVPACPRVLVHVTGGRVEVRPGPGPDAVVLGPGDEVRVETGEPLLLAGEGEALVWRLDVAHVTIG